jgi:hypothetical protein
MPNRQTVHNRKINRLRQSIEGELSEAILKELRWLWRQLYPEIRQMRLKRDNIQKLNFNKQGITNELWEQFNQRLGEAIDSAIMAGAIQLAGETDKYWQGRGFDFTLDPVAIVETYKSTIGTQITEITSKTREEIGQHVADWYNTPGATVQSLSDTLRGYVSESRANSIATTEVTNLNGSVTMQTGVVLGVETYFWNSMRDELVCRKPLTGPDNNIYNGCRGLHGQEFNLNSQPFKAAHPRCKCGPILRVRR